MKKKLLLADDSITIQKVVGIIFARENYELLTVSDGDKAFDLALTHQPDLVIADIVMPGKNGFELCRAIKSHPALGSTSVLLLPGAFEEFDETRAVEVCADGWLTKPFESQALIDKVTALFEMPPLRLVAAEDTAVEVEAVDEISAPEPVAPPVADLPLEAEEEDFFGVDEPLTEGADAAADSDEELWGEVSFEEEDLKPQELLAASDQDEEEPADDSAAEGDDLYEPAQRLTPEQLAPYVSTPLSAASLENQAAPEFEPLPAETGEDFEFITGQAGSEEEARAEGPKFSPAVQMDEPGAPFEFVDNDTLEGDNSIETTTDDTDEMPELMEEDFDQEEDLVEDSSTFIDLTDADVDVTEEMPVDAEISSIQAASARFDDVDDVDDVDDADDEILELTEGDVLEEDEVMVAAPEDTSPIQASSDERDDLFDEQVTEEDEPAEVSFGRRGDDLFTDDVETVTSATDDLEPAGNAAAVEFAAEIAAEELVEVEPEEAEGVTGSYEDSAVVPPLVAAGAPAAEMVEEQLRQLSEHDLKQVVEKVAGPLIERLAREMLEQVVWEVVPDLAESMISAEIEKIKRGES